MIKINLKSKFKKDVEFAAQESPMDLQNLEQIQKQGLLKLAMMFTGILVLFLMEKVITSDLNSSYTKAHQELSKLQSVTSQIPAKSQELTLKTKEYEQENTKLSQFESWIIKRLVPIKILDFLQLELSDQIWFQNITYEYGKQVTVTGSTLSDQELSVYVEKLSKNEYFKEVNLGKVTESSSDMGPIKNFDLYLNLKQ